MNILSCAGDLDLPNSSRAGVTVPGGLCHLHGPHSQRCASRGVAAEGSTADSGEHKVHQLEIVCSAQHGVAPCCPSQHRRLGAWGASERPLCGACHCARQQQWQPAGHHQQHQHCLRCLRCAAALKAKHVLGAAGGGGGGWWLGGGLCGR